MVREDGQKDQDLSKCPIIWDSKLETWSNFKQQSYGHVGSNKANDVVGFVLKWQQWTPEEL